MIPVLFNILFFLIPLIFFKNTSELFEFNKIVTLYTITTMVVAVWSINSIRAGKLIFRRSLLDLPLIIYLSVYLLSTLLSIDPHVSWLGYYSRFNGGFVSQLCYALIYWAFVSNVEKDKALQIINFGLAGTVLASILGIFEHFGIFATCGLMNFGWNESCWVQDVQNRVFSTLGQPNWLAALVTAFLPFVWSKMIIPINKINLKFVFNLLISILLFVTLLFTKSRSGFLAFGVESVIFWVFILWKNKTKFLKEIFLIGVSFLICFLAIQSPFKKINSQSEVPAPTGPALETGGTESGTIRKFVWLGAVNVFKHFPILGTGPETFAFSFPMFKPIGHNLTSEWDFIYNKAHNEYLNYLANTGILGISTYLVLIFISLKVIYDSGNFGLLAGYLSILITNFFGFSVAPVSLLMFIFPALAIILSTSEKTHYNRTRFSLVQKIEILGILSVAFYLLYLIINYWKADIYYNNARNFNRSNKPAEAITESTKALKISKSEGVYLSELALSDGKVDTAMQALELSPHNQNIRKVLINNLVRNAGENPDNLLITEKVIIDGINISPNDPRLFYQLGVLQLKINKNNDAIVNFKKAVELKPNYKEGRFALGMVYKGLNEKEKAKIELEYILKNIDPNDELTQKYLKELN